MTETREIEMIKAGEKDLLEAIKKEYADSEVTSGEFIFSLTFSYSYSEQEVIEAVQDFLDWDESDEEFEIYLHPSTKFWRISDGLPF